MQQSAPYLTRRVQSLDKTIGRGGRRFNGLLGAALLLLQLSAIGCRGRGTGGGSDPTHLLSDPERTVRLLDEAVFAARARTEEAPVDPVPSPATRAAETLFSEAERSAAEGDFERAISLWEAGLRYRPDAVAERLLLIGLLIDEGDSVRAARHVDSLPAPASTAPAVASRARLMLCADLRASARELIWAFVGEREPSGTLRALLGEAECASGRYEMGALLLGIPVSTFAEDPGCARRIAARCRPEVAPKENIDD